MIAPLEGSPPRWRARLSMAIAASAILAIAALAATTVIGGVWLATPRPLPPPRYDEARDLPAIPADAENGLASLLRAPRRASQREKWPFEGVIAEAIDRDALRTAVAARRREILAWAPPLEDRLEVAVAWSRPHMAHACGVDPRDRECSEVPYLRAHRTALALALQAAVRGDARDAFARMKRILRADREMLASARSSLQWLISARLASVSIEYAAAIASLVEPGHEPVGLEAVDRALVALAPEHWSIERALVGSAIFARGAAELRSVDGGGRYGLGRAIVAIDAYYQALIAYARDPEHTPRPVPPASSSFSRAFERDGRRATGALADRAQDVDHARRFADEAVARVTAARATLAASR